MGSNFTIFESAISALGLNSQAISVAANNIANVNTPGYSRQTVNVESRGAAIVGGVELGFGAQLSSVSSVVDRFTEVRLREAESRNGYSESQSEVLFQLEQEFNELNGNGLSDSITNFLNSFQELSTDPESRTARLNVLNQAGIVTDKFNSLSNRLTDAREQIDASITSTVDRINILTSEIADLNTQIKNFADGGALSLRDQRTQKVRELSQYTDVSAIETSDGTFQVYAANGRQLVNGAYTGTLSTQVNTNNDNLLDIYFQLGSETPSNITSSLSNGKLAGLINVRDNTISGYQDQLDEMAYEMATEVNLIHRSGYNLEGNTLIEFFDEDVLSSEEAVGTSLATELRDSNGAHLGIQVGDVISISGDVGGSAIGALSLTVTASTTLDDIAAFTQAALRTIADGDLTETAAVQADGSIQITSDGSNAINNLQLTITGKTNFINAFDFPAAVAGGGATGSSDTLVVGTIDNAASLISLDSAISGFPDRIAASDTAGNVPGGNAVASALGDLLDTPITFTSGNSSFTQFYGNLLGQVGSDSQSRQSEALFNNDVLRQTEIQRERISGVSVEEEQLNLLKFQAAFTAASQLVAIAKDVFDTLANLG